MPYSSKQRAMQAIQERGEPDLNSGCILWPGSVDHAGYGRVVIPGKCFQVHRLAFEAAHGREPSGHVLHSCDTSVCVNPAHLREGDPKQNATDRRVRGRQRNRPSRGPSKAEFARLMRGLLERGLSNHEIMAATGAHNATVARHRQLYGAGRAALSNQGGK
jgi:hypothetical protein